MENFKMSFKVKPGEARLESHGVRAVSASFEDKRLTVQLKYDFSDTPLTLISDAFEGANVEITVRPYRIRLEVNGILTDEEWPAGNIIIDGETVSVGDFDLAFEAIEPEKTDESVYYTRRGIKLDEIRLPGINIGDCMPFSDGRDNKLYHLFWLYDRHHHKSKWGLGAHQWAHISTRDMQTWDEHPMAIRITEKYEGSVCTGSVAYADGKYYAWYAVRMSDRSPARITHAVSEDAVHFNKTMHYFTLPDRYEATSARDPKLIFHDGKFHLIVTTTLLSSGNGCLAHLVSDNADMSDLTDCGPIIEHSDSDQPECPDWFKMGKYYYLVYSIRGTARYLCSQKPFSDWTAPTDNIVHCGIVPKSAEFKGKRIFAGFVNENGYGGSLVMAQVRQNPDGTLCFADLKHGN